MTRAVTLAGPESVASAEIGRPECVKPGSRCMPEVGYSQRVVEYRFTEYFEKEVLRKRPYIRKEWCVRAIKHPIRVERQEHNRYRFWIDVPELGGRFLRVVTLEDKVTIHNAFPDRRFKP